MPEVPIRRRSQRELREGMGPRRLAERSTDQHMRELRWQSGGAGLARRLAVAVVVLFLVIAASVVHGDDYSPPSGPYVGAGWPIPATMPGRRSWDFDSTRSSA